MKGIQAIYTILGMILGLYCDFESLHMKEMTCKNEWKCKSGFCSRPACFAVFVSRVCLQGVSFAFACWLMMNIRFLIGLEISADTQ